MGFSHNINFLSSSIVTALLNDHAHSQKTTEVKVTFFPKRTNSRPVVVVIGILELRQ